MPHVHTYTMYRDELAKPEAEISSHFHYGLQIDRVQWIDHNIL